MQLLLPIIIFIVFLITIHFSKKLKLFDIPNDRKSHSAPVVFTGGLAISLSFIIIIILTNIETSYSKILIFSIPIMILGFIDDLIDIKASIRLIIQISISTLLILHSDLIINNLGYYFHIPLELGSLSIFFTIACVLVEAALVDNNFGKEEKNVIIKILKKNYNLDNIEDLNNTLDKAIKACEDSSDLIT